MLKITDKEIEMLDYWLSQIIAVEYTTMKAPEPNLTKIREMVEKWKTQLKKKA
jgi:hypothetical protein